MYVYKVSFEVYVHEDDEEKAYRRFLDLVDTGFVDHHSYDVTKVGDCTCEGDEASEDGNPDHLCDTEVK